MLTRRLTSVGVVALRGHSALGRQIKQGVIRLSCSCILPTDSIVNINHINTNNNVIRKEFHGQNIIGRRWFGSRTATSEALQSNVGRQPITLPEGVTVSVDEALHRVRVEGPKGCQELNYFENLAIDISGGDEEGSGNGGEAGSAPRQLRVVVDETKVVRDKGRASGLGLLERRRRGPKNTKMMWGTTRSLIYNMVRGVYLGYRVELNLVGVGYRAAFDEKANALVLKLGLSHDVIFPLPEGISCRVPKPDIIRLSGSHKQQLMQAAATVRAFRKPEPYKGKGIRYKGEEVRIKAKKKK